MFLFQATSIVSIITLMDLTGVARVIIARSFHIFDTYTFIGLIYLLITYGILWVFKKVEYRLMGHLRDRPTATRKSTRRLFDKADNGAPPLYSAALACFNGNSALGPQGRCRQQFCDLCLGHRLAEQIALGLIAIFSLQPGQAGSAFRRLPR